MSQLSETYCYLYTRKLCGLVYNDSVETLSTIDSWIGIKPMIDSQYIIEEIYWWVIIIKCWLFITPKSPSHIRGYGFPFSCCKHGFLQDSVYFLLVNPELVTGTPIFTAAAPSSCLLGREDDHWCRIILTHQSLEETSQFCFVLRQFIPHFSL